MCYIRNGIQEGIEILSCSNNCKDRVWIKFWAKYFGFVLMSSLHDVSPETPTHQSSRDSMWSLLEEEIAYFSTIGHIILTGDFNARTGILPGYVSHDSNLHIPLPPDYSVNTPIPRESEGRIVNNYGRELLDLCIASQLRIINGCIKPNGSKGAYTCLTSRGSSVVDYAITSVSFLKYISHFQVGEILPVSDHCPLSLQLSTEPGYFFGINKLNLLSSELLQDILERISKDHKEARSKLLETVSDLPTCTLQASEEKIAEIFASQEFCNKLAALEAELSTSSASECAHRLTHLLQESLKSNPRKKQHANKAKKFPQNA